MTADRAMPYDNAKPQPEDESLGAREAAEARVAERLKNLEHMRLMGMELAARLVETVSGRMDRFQREAFGPVRDVAMSYERITRAIRRIIVLEEEMEGHRAARILAARVTDLEERKSAIRHGIARAMKKADPDLTHEDVLKESGKAFRERSDVYDYDDYATGTPAEIVSAICKDLGLEADLALWTDELPAAEPAPKAPEPEAAPAAQAAPVASPAARTDMAAAIDASAMTIASIARRIDRLLGPNGHDPPI